jgi:hypothetical protein
MRLEKITPTLGPPGGEEASGKRIYIFLRQDADGDVDVLLQAEGEDGSTRIFTLLSTSCLDFNAQVIDALRKEEERAYITLDNDDEIEVV